MCTFWLIISNKNVCHKKPLYIMQYSFHIEVLLTEVGLFLHQIHCKKHLILRYNFLSSQYTGKYLFCSFKYHLWRWRVLKNENIFISYNTDMNYNDIYSKTITALCCTNCQSYENSCLKLNQQHWGECSFQTHRWPGTGLSSPKWGWQHMCTTHQSFASFVYRVR